VVRISASVRAGRSPACCCIRTGRGINGLLGSRLDLIVTLDEATSAIYSAFLVEEEGTASTFRALEEVFGGQGTVEPLPIGARITFIRRRLAVRSTARSRSSFAPETTSPKRNERDRPLMKMQ
jgi:hypothetical protein